MASDFIGYTVLVTLQSPPNAKVQGVVSDVIDHTLLLKDVTLMWSGQHIPAYSIKSYLIADLEVSPSERSQPPESVLDLKTPTATTQFSHAQDVAIASPQPQSFIDPAILSFTKPLNAPTSAPLPKFTTPHPAIVSPVMIADGVVPSPISNSRLYVGAGQSSVSSIGTTHPVIKKKARQGSASAATLTEPFDAMALSGEVVVTGEEEILPSAARKTRRGGPRRQKDGLSQTAPGIIDLKDITNGPLQNKKGNAKGKGWRQTPLVEEVVTSPLKKTPKSKRGKKSFIEDANGWATEDATDIQDMGDFDFASNLSKFDKRRVFDDIRKDDHTADDARLVSFNRLAKPGTNGGKNLHFTENVLDPSLKGNQWQSEAGETEEERQEDHYSSGKGSKRAGSRRPIQSRRGSAFPKLGQGLRTESPRPLARAGTATSPMNGSVTGIRGSFRMGTTNKPCHCVSPLQILEIEQLCTSELGLTEDILSENAGRSIAEGVLKDLPDTKIILFLVGNHKSGARAVAAARHLRNRRLRVTVSVLGGEREDMLLESLRRQLSVYQKGNGYIDKWDELQTKLATGPRPDLIVDALFGMHVTFDELRTDDQATAFEMIRWVNRAAIPIASVDVPSGISASSGMITEVDGEALFLNPKYVICLAAPKTGLANAMAEIIPADWIVSVADIGISSSAWQKHGSRRKHGIEFCSDWVVPLKFVAGSTVV